MSAAERSGGRRKVMPGKASDRQISVLAVDDESTNVELVRAAFEPRGWRVLKARDGGEAIAIVRAERPDLVITDILMPTMDGFEFVRRLREDADATPVLFYTATYHEDVARSLAQAAGANAIVYKDGAIADLITAVDAALDAGASSPDLDGERAAFDEQHLQLLTDTVLDKTRSLRIANLRQAALIKLCFAIASERDTDRMLATACRSARDLMGTRFALLVTYDERGDPDRRAIAGRDAACLDDLLAMPAGDALLRTPHEGGAPVTFVDAASEAGAAVAAVLDATDMIGVPVRTDNHVYGALWVSNLVSGGRVDAEERELLSSLARHVAVSLENDRLLKEVRSGVDLLQAVVNGSEEAVFVKDRQGRYVLVNDRAASIIGRPAASIIGRADRDLLRPGDVDAITAIDSEVMGSGEARVVEEVVGTDGDARTFLSTKMPLRGSDGSVQGLIGYAVEITERKAFENRLRQSQKLEALGRLASGTAHDFNNILTAISGFTELLLASEGGLDQHLEDLTAIRDAADRGSALTRQLLIFGRQQAPRIQTVDVNEAVRDVLRMARPLIGESVRVETQLTKGARHVRIDPLEMEQVILNLILNARDAMDDGGTILVETVGEPGGSVHVRIRDDGIGMSEETQARAFEPFFSTKPIGHGTGLGLSVVHGIVSEAGGIISVESRQGVGSTFTVSLPMAVPETTSTEAPPRPGPAVGPAPAGRVLVVEDEPLVRSFIEGCLRREGYDVVSVASVAEAAAAVTDRPESYVALLCDMILGDGRGPAVAYAAREVAPLLPVIFMSGYVEREVFDDPIVVDSAFLAKPFGADQLRRAIREAFGPSEAGQKARSAT